MENNVVVPEKANDIEHDQMMILKNSAFEKLLQEKKLSLVLDLDHTLLHSIFLPRLTPVERHLFLKKTDDLKNSSNLFRFKVAEKADVVTKLRPGLQIFLKEASKLYQLHVFTKGHRDYAMEILKLIDPEDAYFGCKSSLSTRVFTRESCTDKKSLDLVIGKENGILIIDDQEGVWRDVDKENVLEIPKYLFFQFGSGDLKLSEERDGSENDEWLNIYLRAIKKIHATFFSPLPGDGDVSERDVRVMKNRLLDRN